MEHKGSSFLSGVAISAGFFLFSKELDALAGNGTPNSSFFVYDGEDTEDVFRKYDENVHWPAISMATTKPVGGSRIVVAIGPNGDFWELFPSSADEVLGRVSAGHVNLRRLGVVGDQIYACGMDRQVLERNGTAQWRAFGPGPVAGDPPVVGFEDIGGYGAGEMYAVGWGGEIWWYDEGQWRRVESPTHANLSAMTCAADGAVYGVGHGGALVKGRRDRWQLIDTGRRDDLRDVASFDGQVFAITDHEILRMTDAGLVPETDFAAPNDPPASCLQLLEAADGLVLLGRKDVFVKRDGPWRRLV